MKRAIIAVLIILASCKPHRTDQPDHAVSDMVHKEVSNSMRDPASAQFRDDHIRTIWSRDGDRLVAYCGEVNGSNAFGGKTGFQPYYYLLDTKLHGVTKNLNVVDRPGWFTITTQLDGDRYLTCERPDTERKSGQVFLSTPSMSTTEDAMQQEMNEAVPPVSNDAVPG